MDNCKAGVQFVNYKYDYRQNWMTQSLLPMNQNYDKFWERN